MASQLSPAVQSYPEEILQLPMFYPISKEEAEALILRYNHGIGTYVIRPNVDKNFSFVTISLSTSDTDVFKVRVFIERSANDINTYQIAPSKRFSKFSLLLDFYKENQIYVRQHINNLFLLHPVVIPPKQVQKVLVEIRRDIAISYTGPSKSLEDIGPHGFHQHPSPAEMAGYVQPTTNYTISAQRPEDGKTRQMKATAPFPALAIVSSIQNVKFTPGLPSGSGAVGVVSTPFNKLRSKSESQVQGLDKFQYNNPRRNTICHKEEATANPSLESLKCRPPVPLPRFAESDYDVEIEYSEVQLNRGYFEELYGRLKEEEATCECGLRFEDAELADGWVVHRSDDEQTRGMIFYQNGDITSWHFPQEILTKVTKQQAQFIFYLCRVAGMTPPHQLLHVLSDDYAELIQTQENKLPLVHAIPDILPDSNLSSLSSTTSSSSSTSHPSLSSSSSSSKTDVKTLYQETHGGLSNSSQQRSSLQNSTQHKQQRPRLIKQTRVMSQSSSSSSSPTFRNDPTPYEIPASLFNSLTLSSDSAVSSSHEQHVPIVGTYRISAHGGVEIQNFANVGQGHMPISSPTSPVTPTKQNQTALLQQIPLSMIRTSSFGRGSNGSGVGGTSGFGSDSGSVSSGGGGIRSSGHHRGLSAEDVGESQQVVIRRRPQEQSHYLVYDPQSGGSSGSVEEQLQQPFDHSQHQQLLHQNSQLLRLQQQQHFQGQQPQHLPLKQPLGPHQPQYLPLAPISQRDYVNLRNQQLLPQNSQSFQHHQQPSLQQPQVCQQTRQLPLQQIPQQLHRNSQQLMQQQFQNEQQLQQQHAYNEQLLLPLQESEQRQQQMHQQHVYNEQQPLPRQQLQQEYEQGQQQIQSLRLQHQHQYNPSPQGTGTPSPPTPSTMTGGPIITTTTS